MGQGLAWRGGGKGGAITAVCSVFASSWAPSPRPPAAFEKLCGGAGAALGLKQRILARPLGGRPLGHRKAASIPPHPHGRLFQKPCLHASDEKV